MKPNSIPVRCKMFEMVMEDLSHLEREHPLHIYHFFGADIPALHVCYLPVITCGNGNTLARTLHEEVIFQQATVSRGYRALCG